ncbi:MAG: SpaA isopeptide-forming pilin-related protein, partial [Chloroflexi bacterium]|nr:SpaA isopeptide-forming pilin-related protein [Chloroflexota bacterium]
MFSGGLRLRRNAQTRRSAVFMWTALFIMSIGLQYMVASGPQPVIAASGLKAATVAGFEVDGELLSGNASTNPAGITPASLIENPPMDNGDDWLDGTSFQGIVDPAAPPQSFIFRDAVDATVAVPGDTTPDTSAYSGGTKEDDTRNWSYFNSAGPNPKTDFRHLMAGVKVVNGSPYVFVGAERADIDPSGTLVVDFELNQKPFKTWSDGVSKPNRTLNDLLISLEYSNGGSNPIVTLYRVAAVTTFASGQTVTFAVISGTVTANAVRSATNFVALTSTQFPPTDAGPAPAPYTLAPFTWAEASVNIRELGLPVDCLNFGQGSVRSRTGGSPSTSQLKDATSPFPLSVNTCSTILIEKVDAAGNHLGGATFSISPNPLVGAPASPPLSITDNDANDADARDGYILLTPCRPAETFTVTETSAPAGYIKDAAAQSKTTVAGLPTVFTFTNGLGSIGWEKNGPNGTSPLGGATFTITPDPTDWSGTLTVADNGPNDADATLGEFLVTGVRVDRAGGYTIAETVPPTGYIGSAVTAPANPTSAAPNVVIAAGTFVNTLGSLRWVKNGPGGTSLLGGATFTITPSPLTGTGTLVVADNDANDADKDNGEFEILNARTGTYSVQETTAPTGHIIDPDAASITVSAADRNPQIAAGTFVNNLGTIRWAKYGPDGQTLLGGAIFEVTPNPATGTGGPVEVGDCIALPCGDADKDETPGEFELQGVRVGTYAIVEKEAPAGYIKDT